MNSLTKTLIMNNFTEKEQRIVIAILLAIMEADEIIDPQETIFLDNIIKQFNMSQDELDQISEYDLNLVFQEFKKFDNSKKLISKELFVGMAKCDGFVDPRELKIIENLG